MEEIGSAMGVVIVSWTCVSKPSAVGSLQIRHSLETDEGKYECVAENSVGVAYSYAANLYVRGPYLFVLSFLTLFCYDKYSYSAMKGS